MAHEDRIRQLSDLFIEDLRQPVEASLRQLLAQMMGFAVKEQAALAEEAVQHAEERHQHALVAALEEKKQEHEAALDAALREKDQERERTLDELREELAGYHRQALEALQRDLERLHEGAAAALVGQAVNEADRRLEALRVDLRGERDETVERLVSQAVTDGELRLDALREELTRERDEAVERLVGQAVDDGEARLEALREELTRDHEGALMNLVGEALNDGEGRVQALREELAREHEASVAAVRREHEAAVAALREELSREREASLAALGHADAGEAVPVAAALAAAREQRDAARAIVADLTDQLAEARARHEQLTQLAHAESEAADQLLAGRQEAFAEERQADLACSDRLVSAIRALDEARALGDVLTILSEHLAAEQLRTAVFVVQGPRLRGWRFSGMGAVNASDVDIAIEHAGTLGRAVSDATPVSCANGPDPGAAVPSFLSPPPGRVGLALPLLVGGRTVAVVYADDASGEERAVPSNWPELAEVVTRHAGRCLEALTLARANGFGHRAAPQADAAPRPAVAPEPEVPRPDAPPLPENDEAREEESARRYARLLISEIKLYNEGLVEQGRRDGTLVPLLGGEIERARRLYEEKVPAAVRARVDCFQEEIVRTLAGGDPMLLGQVT